MQHTEEADFCSKVFRVARDLAKGFRTDTKQKIVEDLLVLQDQWRQATRQGEDNMGVGGREKFSPTCSRTVFPSGDLTRRAVSLATTIERDGARTATGAIIDMASECGCTT